MTDGDVSDSPSEGARLIADVFGKRLRVRRWEILELAHRIDGSIKYAVGQERHRCFEIAREAWGHIGLGSKASE